MKRITQVFSFLAMLLFANGIYAQTAKVQVIHNSPDAAAAVVDIYLSNGVDNPIFLDNVAFQTGIPYTDVPAGTYMVSINGPESTGMADAVVKNDFTSLTLAADQSYVVVANGIVSSTGYSPGADQAPLTLSVLSTGKQEAAEQNTVDIMLHHGVTDGPRIDVINGDPDMQSPALFNSLAYRDFEGKERPRTEYKGFSFQDYDIKLTQETPFQVINAYQLDLTTLAADDPEDNDLQGEAVVIVASGFADPSQNSDGAPLELLLYRPSGGNGIPLALPEVPKTQIQLIHNDPDAGNVDIYIDGVLVAGNVAFRSASAYLDVFAGIGIEIDIVPTGTAQNTAGNKVPGIVVFEEDIDYTVIVDNFDAGVPAELDLEVIPDTRAEALDNSKVDVLVYHGSSDAPTVDIFEILVNDPEAEIVSDLEQGTFNANDAGELIYLSLDPLEYILEVRADGSDEAAGVFGIDATGLAGQAITIVASGLLGSTDPADAFALVIFLPDGTSIVAENNPSLDVESFTALGYSAWPNPVVNNLNISFPSAFKTATLSVFDLSGRQVATQEFTSSTTTSVDVSSLDSGIYMMQLDVDTTSISSKFIKK